MKTGLIYDWALDTLILIRQEKSEMIFSGSRPGIHLAILLDPVCFSGSKVGIVLVGIFDLYLLLSSTVDLGIAGLFNL